MVARLFGLHFLAKGRPADAAAQRWSPDRPLDIRTPHDMLDFAYPPESSFSNHDATLDDPEELTNL